MKVKTTIKAGVSVNINSGALSSQSGTASLNASGTQIGLGVAQQRVGREHSVILTAHGGAFYNREKPFYHPIGKDFPWAVLRLSRYPRFVQENNGRLAPRTPHPL